MVEQGVVMDQSLGLLAAVALVVQLVVEQLIPQVKMVVLVALAMVKVAKQALVEKVVMVPTVELVEPQ
jgi:hypothetical protein